MASVYTNDLRLEEIGSGEQSGTWGDTTNTNLELIAEGLSFGTEGITTNADTHTSTVADGATDPARSMFIKYTGTLDSACTITIAPNTLSRVHFIENGTSGSQNIIIKQGSGATITIPPGDTKVVYLDGAGSGAAVVDAFASLSIGALTQDGGAVFNEASADVDFRVESNGNANMLFVDGGNDAVVIGHNNANDGSVSSAFALQNIGTSYNSSSIGLARFSADVNAPAVVFHKSRDASIGGDTIVADNDELGRIRFFGNDGTDFAEGARITAIVNGTPGGGDMPTELIFATSADGAESPTARMAITSAGKIGVGTTAPNGVLDINTAQNTTNQFTTPHITLDTSSTTNSTGFTGIAYSTSTGPNFGITAGALRSQANGKPSFVINTHEGSASGTERLRVSDTGLVTIGSTATSSQLLVKSTVAALNTIFAESENQGAGHTAYFYSNSTQTGNVCRIYKDGAGDASALLVHTDGLFTVAEFNRQSNDGIIIDLKQAGTSEGNIAVSGSTVTYNAFSGSHWARLSDNSKPDLLRGTVIETIDAMCVWYQLEYTIPQVNYTKDDENIPSGKKIGDERYGSQPLVVSYDKPDNVNVGDKINYDHNGTTYEATVTKNGDVKHVQCKVSDTADSTRVYGVFLSWDNDDNSVNDMYVTAVGTNLVRVHKDQTISAGDLLVSNGDGTAKKQDDDIIRSKTIGKALTNIKQETYDDGSYTLPCALYCG